MDGRDRLVVVLQILLLCAGPVAWVKIRFSADTKTPFGNLFTPERVDERLNKLPDIAAPKIKVSRRFRISVTVLRRVLAHPGGNTIQHDPRRESAFSNARDHRQRFGEVAHRLALVIDAKQVVVLLEFFPTEQPHAIDVFSIPIRLFQLIKVLLVQKRRLIRDGIDAPKVENLANLGLQVNDYLNTARVGIDGLISPERRERRKAGY